MEGLGAPRRSHAIDAHDRKAEFRECLHVTVRGREGSSAARAGLRAGVHVVDDRQLLPGVEVEASGREHQAVEVGLAVAGLDHDGYGRLPARGFELGDVFADDVDDDRSLGVAEYADLRLGGGGEGVDEEAVVSGRRDDVVGLLGRQQLQVRAVEVYPVVHLEVRIFACFLADSAEEQHAGFLVDPEQLRDVPVAVGDLVLQLAGRDVVKVEVAPVVFLGEPDELVRSGEIVPVDLVVAGLIELGCGLSHHLADVAGVGVRKPHPLLLVVAGGGDKREGFGVGGPLDVVPAAATSTANVVTKCRPVLIGWHLQAGDFYRVQVDDDTLDHGDVLVARERILQDSERGVTGGDIGQVEFAGLALILLEGGDSFGVWRPDEDGVVGVGPASVVGGVAVVFDAVGSKLRLLVGRDVAHPKVPVADECGFGSVGRVLKTTSARTAPTPAGSG